MTLTLRGSRPTSRVRVRVLATRRASLSSASTRHRGRIEGWLRSVDRRQVLAARGSGLDGGREDKTEHKESLSTRSSDGKGKRTREQRTNPSQLVLTHDHFPIRTMRTKPPQVAFFPEPAPFAVPRAPRFLFGPDPIQARQTISFSEPRGRAERKNAQRTKALT